MIRVILVDDDEIVLNALKIILEKDGDIKVMAMARNGNEASSLCERIEVDIVLMDVVMPICDGVKGTKLIKDTNKSIKIIMVTTFDEEEYIHEALKNGADGYILKNICDNDIKNAVRSTAAGFSIMNQSVLECLKSTYDDGPKNKVGDREVEVNLTNREKEVLRLIVDGMSNKDISSKLFLVEGRVKNIVSNMLMKTGLKDRTQLAIYAIKNDLV